MSNPYNADEELKKKLMIAIGEHAAKSDKGVSSFKVKWEKDGPGMIITGYTIQYKLFPQKK